MFATDSTGITIAIVIAVIMGLVEFSKKLGIDGNASLILSMVLGILFGVVFELQSMYPQISPWVNIVVGGLVTALTASGLYDLGKRYLGS
jgi:L-cystine uptake protein TcyP (sodium:dicarboxylate symporter family)